MKPTQLGAVLLGISLLAPANLQLFAQTLPPTQITHAFYSTQNPEWPPLPDNVLGLPQAEISPGVFWLDDLNVNYQQLQQEALLLNALESSLEEGPPSPPGAGGEESPPAGNSGDALGGRLFLGSCTGHLLSPVYQVTNLVLSISGATTGDQYDLYTTASLSVTNWTWLGRWTNAAASWTINNPPTNESYYAVASVDDADGEGLPDVYEVFVTHTNPNDPDTDYDGRNDYEELGESTSPLNNTSFTPARLGYFRFNDASLIGERGQLPLATNALQSLEAWITKGVQLTNSAAQLKYKTVESDGKANINLRSGTVRFWFKPGWNSGGGNAPANGARLLEVGQPGSNGWWSVYLDAGGSNVVFVSQTNGASVVTNLVAAVNFTSNRWSQLVLTYTNGAVALYTNGVLCATNSASVPYPGLDVRTNGFTLGSDDGTGTQVKGVFEDVEMFNYPLTPNDILENFQLTQPPMLIPNLQQWLLASLVHTNAPDRIDLWPDQSGNSNNASSSGTSRPSLVASAINGLSVVRFVATNGNYFPNYLTNSMATWTQAEAYVVLRVTADQPSGSRALWQVGPNAGSQRYPTTGGEILEGFATSTAQRNIGSTSQSLTNFHLYNVVSKAGEWTARLNGVVKFTTSSNVVGFASTPYLGFSGAYFDGDIAELLIFNRVLTGTEREGVNTYLNQRFQFISTPPQTPTNLTANVLSPGQISLWWNIGTNNEQTVYSVERGLDGSNFTEVARIEGASFIDSSLATNTAYAYRVKASNLAGAADYTTAVTVVTATNGVDMPLAPGSLKLWLKSDDGAPPNFDGTLETWLDKSGNTNIVTYPTSENATRRPFCIQTTNQLNNHPVLRFYGSNWLEIRFTSPITNWTSAEAFFVIMGKTNSTLGTGPGHWRFGGSTVVLYPRNSDLVVLDSFASTISQPISNIFDSLALPHLYNVSSQSGEWSVRLNSTAALTRLANTVTFPTTYIPTLGVGLNPFDGDMVELLIYSPVLSADQRATVNNYLRRKYDLW